MFAFLVIFLLFAIAFPEVLKVLWLVILIGIAFYRLSLRHTIWR
ncbi:hypothetical protein OKW39_008984 [Paraburkholderia sp. MM6662-R1]